MQKKQFSDREHMILHALRVEETSTADLLGYLARRNTVISEDSLARDIARLKALGFVESAGKGPSRKHELTSYGRLLAPLSFNDLAEYLSRQRQPIRYNPKWMEQLCSADLFDAEERQDLDGLQATFTSFMQDASDAIKNRWYQKWLIEFAWKSSAIEGNTYDVLETETLLVEHIEATGKTHNEAVMILNHQSAIRYAYEHPDIFAKPAVRAVEEVHTLLTDGLGVSKGIRNIGVGIGGSAYRPLAIGQQIREGLEMALGLVNKREDTWSNGLAMVLALSYLQPFEDGNKRTARVMMNALLHAHSSMPLVLSNVDPTSYRRACLAFYEMGSVHLMKEIVIGSWRRTVDELQV